MPLSEVDALMLIDAQGNVIPTDGVIQKTSKSLVASNETLAVPIFRVSGSIHVAGLWAVVTTVLGSNVTAAYFRFNDQTAQSDITLNTGVTLSSAAAGSLIVKKGLAGAAATLLTSAQERVSEPTTLETKYFSPFVLVSKPSANTDVEFVYTTTQEPTSGAIQFFLMWIPLSEGATVQSL